MSSKYAAILGKPGVLDNSTPTPRLTLILTGEPRMRNTRKTRFFARVQNLISENPRKLARIVEDDDLNSLYQDERRRPAFFSDDVQGVYGSLWEKVPGCT